jgi:hypothetical protein
MIYRDIDGNIKALKEKIKEDVGVELFERIISRRSGDASETSL